MAITNTGFVGCHRFLSVTECLSFRCFIVVNGRPFKIHYFVSGKTIALGFPARLGCLGEHRELPYRDPGRSPSRKLISGFPSVIEIVIGPIKIRLLMENHAFDRLRRGRRSHHRIHPPGSAPTM